MAITSETPPTQAEVVADGSHTWTVRAEERSLWIAPIHTPIRGSSYLIAAAPELFEALREFFTSGDFDIQTTGDEAATQAWIVKARAAIAKATGTPPTRGEILNDQMPGAIAASKAILAGRAG